MGSLSFLLVKWLSSKCGDDWVTYLFSRVLPGVAHVGVGFQESAWKHTQFFGGRGRLQLCSVIIYTALRVCI